ncbi:MAG: glycosyltransferase family 4 protein [Bacteroidales bacterium]
MKLLIISPYFPYPLNSGGNTAQYLLIEELRRDIDITLLCPETEEASYLELKSRWPNVDICVYKIKPEVPEIKQGFVQQVKNTVQSAIVFLKLLLLHQRDNSLNEVLSPKEHMQYLKLSKIQIEEGFINYIGSIYEKSTFDIVQIEFLPLISLGLMFPKTQLKIFIHHEIGFVRTQREIETLDTISAYDRYIADLTKTDELNRLTQYDNVVTFSAEDKNVLKQYIKNRVDVSPFAVQVKDHKKISTFKLSSIVFLGGEEHYPNKDGLEWFIQNCFKQIREAYPELKLNVVGKWSNTTIKKHETVNGIEFLGYVDDLASLLAGQSALIVPLRIGSGIRTKILEAFAMRLPVISSTIGIEGIPAISDIHYLKADNDQEYISAITQIYENSNQTIEMTGKAFQDIVPLYEINRCALTRINLYKDLVQK